MMQTLSVVALFAGVFGFIGGGIYFGNRYIDRMLGANPNKLFGLVTPLKPFKPCVIYNEQIKLTEMILEDTSIVWCPWGPFHGHAVDCGYSPDGRLVGIQIWDDVRTRPQRS